MNPFLTCSSLPHLLHRSAIRSPRRQSHCRPIWAIYAALKPSNLEVVDFCAAVVTAEIDCHLEPARMLGVATALPEAIHLARDVQIVAGLQGWRGESLRVRPDAHRPTDVYRRYYQSEETVSRHS